MPPPDTEGCTRWEPDHTSRDAKPGEPCLTDETVSPKDHAILPGKRGTCVKATCKKKVKFTGQGKMTYVDTECLRCEVAKPDAGAK